MTNKTIGSFIATLRKDQTLTQEALAEKLGVSNRSVSRWENGNTLPELSVMYALCDVFGITMAELLAGQKQGHDTRWPDTVRLVLELAHREKVKKSRKLNLCFAAGLVFLLMSMVVRPYLPGLQAGIPAGIGIALQILGLFHNNQNRPLTSEETAVLTSGDAPKMKTAEEMVQFAKKSQQADLKQYKTAFQKIAASLWEQEYVRFTMVAEEFSTGGNPGPWHAGIAVTEQRIFLCGEFPAGRFMTRTVVDVYFKEELLAIQYEAGKILLKTSGNIVALRGENLKFLTEKLTKAIKTGR